MDAELGRFAAAQLDEGYAIFPTSAERATYRSGVTSSTIDFVFHRNVKAVNQDIARVFIAQHKPITCSFDPLPNSTIESSANTSRAFGTSKLLVHT